MLRKYKYSPEENRLIDLKSNMRKSADQDQLVLSSILEKT